MLTPIHMMLMTNHLVQQNQMMMLRHRQQQARNAAIKKSKSNPLQPVYGTPCEVRNERGKESTDCDECEYNFSCPYA